jgi:hypothetical protein
VVELFDLTGRKVFTDHCASGVYKFQRGAMPSGVYIMKVRYGNEQSPLVMKMVLE